MLPLADVIVRFVMRLVPRFYIYANSWRLLGTEGIGGYYVMVSMVRIVLIALVFFLNDRDPENKNLYYLSFYMIISIGFILMKTRVGIANRVVYYFDPFVILFIPKVLRRIKASYFEKGIIYTLAYLYGWVCFIYMLSGDRQASRGCVPYIFFWQ